MNEQRCISIARPIAAGVLAELQSAMGNELDALLPSVLDRAFKGEL